MRRSGLWRASSPRNCQIGWSCMRGLPDAFDMYKLESAIDKALARKVWLKNGGYIIIDHAALDCHRRKYGEIRRKR